MLLVIKSLTIMGIIHYGFAYFVLYQESVQHLTKKHISIASLLILLILASYFSVAMAIILVCLTVGAALFHKKNQHDQGKRMIEFYGYKIFKFLMNQIMSGILVSDAIKGMYRVVEHQALRQCLIEVAAYYAKTNNIKEALDILKKAYKSLEVDTLCMAIEQGIHTGTHMDTLNKIEALLFKRYIHQIQLETKWRKKRSLLSVLLLCLILILMIAMPVISDITSAMKHIFIY